MKIRNVKDKKKRIYLRKQIRFNKMIEVSYRKMQKLFNGCIITANDYSWTVECHSKEENLISEKNKAVSVV